MRGAGNSALFVNNACLQYYSTLTLVNKSLGDLSDVGTPGPIPNPAVKDVSADGTWGVSPRESRSLPRGFLFNKLKALKFIP